MNGERPWVTVTVGSEALGDSEVDAEWALGVSPLESPGLFPQPQVKLISAMVVMPPTWEGRETGTGRGQGSGTFHACQAEEDGDFPPPRAAGHRRELRLIKAWSIQHFLHLDVLSWNSCIFTGSYRNSSSGPLVSFPSF